MPFTQVVGAVTGTRSGCLSIKDRVPGLRLIFVSTGIDAKIAGTMPKRANGSTRGPTSDKVDLFTAATATGVE